MPVIFRADASRGTPEAGVFTALLPMRITGPLDFTGAVPMVAMEVAAEPVVVLGVPLTVLLLMLPKATGWVDVLLL